MAFFLPRLQALFACEWVQLVILTATADGLWQQHPFGC